MKKVRVRYMVFAFLIANNSCTTIFCMQNNPAHPLNEHDNIFLAIKSKTVDTVRTMIDNGIDPNSSLPETNLTPLGTACQLLSTEFQMLQERIDEVFGTCCGCLKVEDATSDIEDEIVRLENIIVFLAECTGKPKNIPELNTRCEALKLIRNNSDCIIAFNLEKTLGTFK